MGGRSANFYNNLAIRYGYEAEARDIQEHFLNGRKTEAVAAVPAAFVDGVSAIGPAAKVKDQLGAFAEAGVTTLAVSPVGPPTNREDRVALIGQLASMISL